MIHTCASLGTFQTTPRGIVATESGFTPARAFLNHRRARFVQRPHARLGGGRGPGEILGRENSELTARLRRAAAIDRDGTAETQEWSSARRFPGKIPVEERTSALLTAKNWNRPDTVWADGSRQDSGRVGAACVWRTQEGWTGRRHHLSTNKEVYDAETFAIYQALRTLDQRQEGGHQYTVFVDSTSAINRAGDDGLGRSALRGGGHRGLLTHPRKRQRGHHLMGPGAQRGQRQRDGRRVRKGCSHRQCPGGDRGSTGGTHWRDVPIPHDKGRYRGPVTRDGGLD